MLLLEPSLRYVLGGNFLSAVQSAQQTQPRSRFMSEAARRLLKTKAGQTRQGSFCTVTSPSRRVDVSECECAAGCMETVEITAVFRVLDCTAGGPNT